MDNKQNFHVHGIQSWAVTNPEGTIAFLFFDPEEAEEVGKMLNGDTTSEQNSASKLIEMLNTCDSLSCIRRVRVVTDEDFDKGIGTVQPHFDLVMYKGELYASRHELIRAQEASGNH